MLYAVFGLILGQMDSVSALVVVGWRWRWGIWFVLVLCSYLRGYMLVYAMLCSLPDAYRSNISGTKRLAMLCYAMHAIYIMTMYV